LLKKDGLWKNVPVDRGLPRRFAACKDRGGECGKPVEK